MKEKCAEYPRCPNHVADAAMHTWRYLSRAPVPPSAGSDEWLRAEIDRLREAEEAQLRACLGDQEPPVGLDEWYENRDPSLTH